MTRKGGMIREGGKPREVVAQSQNQEAERNWTDLLYRRSWAVSGAVQWRGIRAPLYQNQAECRGMPRALLELIYSAGERGRKCYCRQTVCGV